MLLPALCALLGADERAGQKQRFGLIMCACRPSALRTRLACAKKAAQRVLPSRRPHSSESRAQTNSESVHGDAHVRLRVSHRADRILCVTAYFEYRKELHPNEGNNVMVSKKLHAAFPDALPLTRRGFKPHLTRDTID